jgi:hypothetical protein
MGKICWNTGALIALLVLSQIAPAVPASGAAEVADHSVNDSLNDRGRDLDKATVLAQTGVPAAPATTPPQDSRAPADQSPPAASPPPASVSTSEVARPAPSGPGCAVRYLAAELAGKLNGRKWKQFHQEECGASNAQVVFPTMIAPKYAGEKPDKARTLTCADQFSANKANSGNGNGGLKWIERSGGYYSECVARLKG